MTKILLVDDEPNILNSLRRVIHAMPWTAVGDNPVVETFNSPSAALERAQENAFDLVISDYRMPEMDGVSFLERLVQLQPGIARIILSGYADLQAVVDAINKVQIFRFVSKPWNDFELTTSIIQAIEHRRLIDENQRLADELRMKQGQLSRHELELRRLESEFPGLTRIKRAADGSIDLGIDLGMDLEQI
jgi:YesN/AraC family two-component response regulator